MPLTAHDAEERSRQLIGAVIDAGEQTSETGLVWRSEQTREAAAAHIFALNTLVNRTGELLAELHEQVRLALTPDATNEENRQYRNRYIAYVSAVAARGAVALPYDRWLAVAEESNR